MLVMARIDPPRHHNLPAIDVKRRHGDEVDGKFVGHRLQISHKPHKLWGSFIQHKYKAKCAFFQALVYRIVELIDAEFSGLVFAGHRFGQSCEPSLRQISLKKRLLQILTVQFSE